MTARLVVISGCSGGGKSTLLAELARRGHGVVEEPGRRIVRDELEGGGQALPWIDLEAFAPRAIEVAKADLAAAGDGRGLVFFDRGLVDAEAALAHATGERVGEGARPYGDTVFLTPPWPEIYLVDPERQHGLAEAEAEYARLIEEYGRRGYRVVVLPKAPVEARADFIERELGVAAAT